MGSNLKGRRKVHKAVVRFCKKNGYRLESFDMAKGKNHGKIKVRANGETVTVGMSSSPKAGWESVSRMVVCHIKAKIRANKNR